MNERTEKKLTDLSGMNRAVNEILQQAWERGRKYGNEEKKDVEERPIRGIARTDKNGDIKIELLRPQADERAIDILTNYEKTICNDCLLRPCGVPCRLLTALRYAIKYMKGDIE